MELNKTKSGYYILISASVTLVFLLGSWWLFLVFKLANKLQDLNHPLLEGNLIRMIKYEGLTFFILLLILGITLFYLYLQDFKKTKSMQAFFASLTHELKTPLASMKLQSQVLTDQIEDMSLDNSEKEKLIKYTDRIVNDSLRLEDQLDNHLQLSRVERRAPLNLREINLHNFLQNEKKRYQGKIDIKLEELPTNFLILADDFALQTIFRNLFENTIKHGEESTPKAIIKLINTNSTYIEYSDNGKTFHGDFNQLGRLFYKYNSPQGTGIGVYLIKKLIGQLGGELKIEQDKGLKFHLHFKTTGNEE